MACKRHVPSWPVSDKTASLINNEVELLATCCWNFVVVATLFLVAADNDEWWRENDSTSLDRYVVQIMMAIRRWFSGWAGLVAETMIDILKRRVGDYFAWSVARSETTAMFWACSCVSSRGTKSWLCRGDTPSAPEKPRYPPPKSKIRTMKKFSCYRYQKQSIPKQAANATELKPLAATTNSSSSRWPLLKNAAHWKWQIPQAPLQ